MEYWSIENILGVDPRCSPLSSDVFSLGLIFLELILGECIFDGQRTSAQHVDLLLAVFGPSIILPFESQLKAQGLWPAQSSLVKNAKSTLGHFLFRRMPK